MEERVYERLLELHKESPRNPPAESILKAVAVVMAEEFAKQDKIRELESWFCTCWSTYMCERCQKIMDLSD